MGPHTYGGAICAKSGPLDHGMCKDCLDIAGASRHYGAKCIDTIATFIKFTHIWQLPAKFKYSPSRTDQTNSLIIMLSNLKTHLNMFSDILQE